MSKNSLQVMPE